MTSGYACRAMVGVAGILLLILPEVRANTSEQIWIDYNPSWWPKENLEVFGDVGVRTELDNDDWWMLVVRPSLRVPYKNVRFTAGVGNFYTFHDVLADRWEVRPFQGVETTWPAGQRFSLEHYLRLEERFDFNTETWNSLSSARLRYQLLANYWLSAFQEDRVWSVLASAEGFMKLAGDDNIRQEQARVTAGIQRDMGMKRRLAIEVSWQQETLFFRPNDPINEFILRVRLYR